MAITAEALPTITTTAEDQDEYRADVVVPPAEKLDREEVRAVVGAKNVMGTCSG